VLIYKFQESPEVLFEKPDRVPDTAIIELNTLSTNDRLILAMIPPRETLLETVKYVQSSISNKTPQVLQEASSLRIPVLNLKFKKHYNELSGIIRSRNPRFDGNQLFADQLIRFKLDETGAILKSEAHIYMGISQDIIFGKPFLIMLQQKDSPMPYFALWVDNPEVLVTFKGSK
jgi:hypothetical protein